MKNEVILINLPPSEKFEYKNAGTIYPATGILLIGSILKKGGYKVIVIDGAIEREYVEEAIKYINENTAFIGFSVMTSQLSMAYDASRLIKEKNSGIKIIWGGMHPTLFPEQTVNNPFVDIAVVDEGSKTVCEIMDYLNGKQGIDEVKGIAFFKGKDYCRTAAQDADDINELPHFDFSLINVDKYLSARNVYARELLPEDPDAIRLMPILSGLGCCYRCAFCINYILKRKYRPRSADSLVDEIKKLKGRYNANAFLFLDEDFCIDKKRLYSFVEKLKGNKIDFYGRIWCRVSYFRKDEFRGTIKDMERVGIRSIAMGVESGSHRVLERINKSINIDDVNLASSVLANTKITPRYSFIAGLEGEKKKDTFETYRLCADLIEDNIRTDIAGPFIFRYYPGSPIFNDMVKKYNIDLPGDIDGWRKRLDIDGSLKVDFQNWTWKGFLKYTKSMNNYLKLYTNVMKEIKTKNTRFFKFLFNFILWRLRNSQTTYLADYLLMPVITKIFYGYKKIVK